MQHLAKNCELADCLDHKGEGIIIDCANKDELTQWEKDITMYPWLVASGTLPLIFRYSIVDIDTLDEHIRYAVVRPISQCSASSAHDEFA
jgi:hypothetical protein